ncbi:alanine:cation symporter family protein [Candidatus Similichlamydia epinepheli]|uniref:alanine:cation symporter family protein n=1 Tax=Candidatus Similichlamydia epinepheli TaxID=1903953 RepID=UPI000D35E6E4|nr:alanine:cation symporter family protein [Candidatus Similichlamydia epinepheli]
MISALECFFSNLVKLDTILWGYVGVPLIMIVGLYFSVRSRFLQFRALPSGLKSLFSIKERTLAYSFFASVGGAVGIGNVVAVSSLIKTVGPGAVLWFWIGSIFGILLKYVEVYLSILLKGKTNGMVSYLSVAFHSSLVPYLASFFSCIYGIEVYQFNIVRDSISDAWGISKCLVSCALLIAVLVAAQGGFKRIGSISILALPFLISLYLFMALIVIFVFRAELPGVFIEIFTGCFSTSSAFTGTGAGFLFAASQSLAKGCYATDVGIGYSGMIYSSSSNQKKPYEKAKMVLLEPLFDSFGVCTLSILLVLVTGVWKMDLPDSFLVQAALGTVLPYSKQIISVLLVLLGYSTIIAFLAMGIESAKFFCPKRGKLVYEIIAGTLLFLFSFVEAEQAFLLMSLCGFGLLCINILAFVKLRKHVHFCDHEKW